MRYLLLISLLLASAVYADTYETEPNDDMGTADQLDMVGFTRGQLASPSDQDWFEFTVSSPDQIATFVVTFDINPMDGYYGLKIYDSAGNVLAAITNRGAEIRYTLGFATTGKHYAVMYAPYSFAWYSDPYKIDITTESDCVVEATLQQQDDREGLLDTITIVRDHVFAQSPQGQELIDAYYRHSDEVKARLLASPTLALQALHLLRLLQSDMEDVTYGLSPMIDSREMHAIRQFTRRLQVGASPDLATDLAQFLTLDLDDLLLISPVGD